MGSYTVLSQGSVAYNGLKYNNWPPTSSPRGVEALVDGGQKTQGQANDSEMSG